MMTEESRKKKDMISGLKKTVLIQIEEGFIENFKFWKDKMETVNSIINHVDEELSIYNYNEFCVKVIDVLKFTLENVINYEVLFLSKEEYREIESLYPDSPEKINEACDIMLKRKFDENMRFIVDQKILTETVKYKAGDKFGVIKDELEESTRIASSILKDNLDE